MLTREEVIWCYRVILGRDPENDQVIEQRTNNIGVVGELVAEIMRSKEFHSPECVARLRSTAPSAESAAWAHQLLLSEQAEPGDVARALRHSNSLLDLVTTLSSGKKYKEKFIGIDEVHQDGARLGKALNSASGMPPKIVFLHIPKTAGSSFEKIANKNYLAECSIVTSGKISVDLWRRARLVGGHIPYQTYTHCDFEKLFISVVRNPVDRAISRFNYYATLPEGPQKASLGPDFYANDIYQTLFDSPFSSELVDNYQCRFLFGKHLFHEAREAFAREDYVLGAFEDLDLWCYYLAGKLGWRHVSLPKVNAASSSNYLERYKQDKQLVEKILQRSEEDQELYQYVRSQRVLDTSLAYPDL